MATLAFGFNEDGGSVSFSVFLQSILLHPHNTGITKPLRKQMPCYAVEVNTFRSEYTMSVSELCGSCAMHQTQMQVSSFRCVLIKCHFVCCIRFGSVYNTLFIKLKKKKTEIKWKWFRYFTILYATFYLLNNSKMKFELYS